MSFFRWPLPALLAWTGSWVIYGGLSRLGVAAWLAMSLATLAGAMLSVLAATFWRRIAIAAGFPLSLLISGSVTLPAWAWLLPLVLVAIV
ncbi:MAG: class I SAM-dependent methyltransferase, partial [Burkholderiaceae bacterium]